MIRKKKADELRQKKFADLTPKEMGELFEYNLTMSIAVSVLVIAGCIAILYMYLWVMHILHEIF